MHIICLKESLKQENRVAMTPDSAQQLIKLGFTCSIQRNAGKNANFHNSAYQKVGVKILNSSKQGYESADIIVKVNTPTTKELQSMKAGTILISYFYPAFNESLLAVAKIQKITVLAMDLVPRISRAQKMDALSSMANIAGYRAVIEAGNHFGRLFSGQITSAGKIAPAKVLVIGAGVAGLAAIGTANSLGAIVYAFDVRPEVAEQIESMGAEFLLLDFAEDASTSSGYAAPSSPEFREKQLELFRSIATDMDIVITTALIPGREAPKLWLKDMVELMKPGSVVIDLAAERGGNCDLTEVDQVIVSNNQVKIVGYTNYPSLMATQTSMLYANNIFHLLSDLTPKKDGNIEHNMDDDIIRGVTTTLNGKITFPPPPPKVKAIAQPKKDHPSSTEELAKKQLATTKHKQRLGWIQIALLTLGGLLTLWLGKNVPSSFMQHFSVFVLACFIGYQVIWNVSHALHTPLMAITNAISGIIIIGALLQLDTGNALVTILASIAVFIATINIVGGFYVTRRMLKMFQKS